MKKSLSVAVIVVLGFVSGLAASPAHAASTSVSSACTDSESWALSSGIEPRSRSELQALISDEISPSDALVEAEKIRKSATQPEAVASAKYLQGRALLVAGATHAAYERFSALAAQMPSRSTLDVQLASLVCLNRIHDELPGIALPRAVTESLSYYLRLETSNSGRQPIWQFAVNSIRAQIDEKRSDQDLKPALSVLQGSGPHETFARGMIAASRNDDRATIVQLETLFGKDGRHNELPASLKKHADYARMALARSYYALKQYESASRQYDQVNRSSNLVPEMLTELAWSQIQAGNYGKAIGVGSQMQAGPLKNTFAPETAVVRTMALNELCQYPTAKKSARSFYSAYHEAHDWLLASRKRPTSRSLYELAVAHLEKRLPQGTVPAKVMSQWLASHVFSAGQSEIRELFREEQALAELADELPESMRASVNADSRRLADRRQTLADQIETDFQARNAKMLTQLDRAAETMKLIQIEVNNGASHEMIFQNANPDYQKASKSLGKSTIQATGASSTTWSWGNTNPSDEHTELWDDEIGALEARLPNQCSTKDAYVGMKTKKRGPKS